VKAFERFQIVHQATPTITWAAPSATTYGTPLSASQLNATASVPGTLVYTPAAGSVPAAGVQTLSVTFTPTDATDYNSATKTPSAIEAVKQWRYRPYLLNGQPVEVETKVAVNFSLG